jgi:two-component sensor histidine kinase
LNSTAPYQNSEYLLKVIHNFIKISSSAETFQEVFWAITKNFMESLQIEDCVVYEALPHERKIIQRAAHGAKNPNGEIIQNLLTLDFGVGIAGWVAENQETVCCSNTLKDERYIVDDAPRLSELSVPIKFNGELFGVIDSENSNENYYSPQHVQLFELIAELASTLLVRIRQKEELSSLQKDLELLLERKKLALNEAIETVSEKMSELKHQEEKKEILIREVHHRVNNNLQILTSLINIYLNENENIDRSSLKEIQQKIQTLSSIHLILLKSVENNKPSFNDFLLDLIASIRYSIESNYLSLTAETKISILSMNTLIPLGMLINELVRDCTSKFWKLGEAVDLNLSIIEVKKSFFQLELTTSKKIKKSPSKNETPTFIDVFIDQLEGEIVVPENNMEEKNTILWKINLKELD